MRHVAGTALLLALLGGGCTSTTITGGSSGTGGESTSSGSSSGTTGTSGTTTGRLDCPGDGGLAPLNVCARDGDCACPARCVLDLGLSPFLLSHTQKECELPCATSVDCASPSEHCVAGSCAPDLCNEMLADGGLSGAPPWGPCDVDGSGDGTCIDTQTAVLSSDQNTLLGSFLCFAPGASDGGCVPGAKRGEPQDGCALGLFCERPGFVSGLDAGSCRRGCVPGGADTCDVGEDCGADHVCHSVGAGGCLTDFIFESVTCTVDSDCGCPHHCRADPGLGISHCVESCQSSADCSLDDDHCVGGECLTNFCVADILGNAAPGSYGQACDATDVGDGNCLAVGFEGGENFPGEFEYGLCLRAGRAASSCSVPFQNQTAGIPSFALVTFSQEIGLPLAPDELCPGGDICALVDGGAACVPLCDPLLDGGGKCAVGACLEQGGDPIVDLGACLACRKSGEGCALDSDCCSGHCGGGPVCD